MTYTVGAIFEVGVYDYDKTFVVMPMQDAQPLLMMGDQVGMIEVQIERPGQGRRDPRPDRSRYSGRGGIINWRQMNSALFEALEVERMAMFVVLSLIILVAVFNILSSLIMLVRAKTRDIAILRTMGASRSGMMKMFVTVGVTIGSLGIVLGIDPRRDLPVLPPGRRELIQFLTGQNLWDPSIRYLTELPSKTDPFEVAAIVIVALVLSFLATLYPALQGGEHRPRAGAAL